MRLAFFFALLATPAAAHFGMILPSDTMVTQEDGREITLQFSFAHPFENEGLELAAPLAAKVFHGEAEEDILGTLKAQPFYGAAGYTTEYSLARPGTYAFVMEPQPYWEPAEDVYIQHITKTYISAFDDDSGWDGPLGLRAEIVPLTRPYAAWGGTVFRGRVEFGGAPLPFAEIEVEHYNETGVSAPSELMITETIVADENGVFTYATPAPGWWGFAALKTADEKIAHEGTEKDLELGAVLWVHFEAWGK